MAPFRDLSDHELQLLGDDDLLAYIRLARDVGRPEVGAHALCFLVSGYWMPVFRRVSRKVAALHAEDVAAQVLLSAIDSAFHGRSVGEFRSWLNTITDRRIADFHRKRRVETTPLSGRGDDDEDGWGVEPSVESEVDAVGTQEIIERVCTALSPAHQDVIDLYIWGSHPAGEAAAEFNRRHPDAQPPMTENNVHAIGSRFRTELRRALEETEE